MAGDPGSRLLLWWRALSNERVVCLIPLRIELRAAGAGRPVAISKRIGSARGRIYLSRYRDLSSAVYRASRCRLFNDAYLYDALQPPFSSPSFLSFYFISFSNGGRALNWKMKGRRNFAYEIRASNGTAGETTALDTKGCTRNDYRDPLSGLIAFFFFSTSWARLFKGGE